MSRHPVSAGNRAETAARRQELLARLGLTAEAGDQDVEAAHNALVEFLELAPHEVRQWAAAQTTELDEAFALLSGPEQDLVPADDVAETVDLTKTPEPSVPASAPAPAPSPVRSPAPAAAPAASKTRRNLVWAVAAVLVAAVGFGVFSMGNRSQVPGISGTPTGQETTAASGGPTTVPVDQKKVAALMTKISANPKDTASLQALGDIYFGAADYKNASGWEQRILNVDPKNQVALLAFGVAQYNQGNSAAAKKSWLVAAALYPKMAVVHNDLGFLYMSSTPPDNAKAIAEFKKVLAIDPSSPEAKTVLTHLKSLETPAPGASAKPSTK